jgi:hypothetical protein
LLLVVWKKGCPGYLGVGERMLVHLGTRFVSRLVISCRLLASAEYPFFSENNCIEMRINLGMSFLQQMSNKCLGGFFFLLALAGWWTMCLLTCSADPWVKELQNRVIMIQEELRPCELFFLRFLPLSTFLFLSRDGWTPALQPKRRHTKTKVDRKAQPFIRRTKVLPQCPVTSWFAQAGIAYFNSTRLFGSIGGQKGYQISERLRGRDIDPKD